MKLTKAGRNLIISRIKKGKYTSTSGIHMRDLYPLPAWIIWYRTGRSFEIVLGITGGKGESIDLPVGKWDEYLIKRALKKYCK